MLRRRQFLKAGGLLVSGTAFQLGRPADAAAPVLRAEAFRHHIDFFNSMISEGVVQHIPNAQAWEWLASNVPLFECPDPDFERTWYFRWWTFRKHIRKTPRGFILTEFLRPVKHATEYNAISCALGHHLAEGRWLHDQRYLDDYLLFWLRSGPGGGLQPQFHQYSGWAAHAAYERWLVHRDDRCLSGIFEALVADYRKWEEERLLPSGLFWQHDVRDGMEESVSGSRTAKNARPTINSYMYANARALARIAALSRRPALEQEFEAHAAALKERVLARLWDGQAGFFKSFLESGTLADVREEIGFIPWMFSLPEDGRGFETAWKQLMDPAGSTRPSVRRRPRGDTQVSGSPSKGMTASGTARSGLLRPRRR
jgi:hypothetical protein